MNTQIFYKKASLLLLTVLFQFNMQATTIFNSTSGSFSLNQSQYLNNMYQEWLIESGQNFPLLITYEVDIEGNYDYLHIYAIDNYDNLQLIKTVTGSDAGVCSTQLPTGRSLIVFETDGSVCGTDGGYQGFTINFGLENQQNDTHIINRLYVNENSFVNGNSSVIGNLSIGKLNNGSKSVNIYNNQKNQFGLYVYSQKSWSSETYGIYSRAINGTWSSSGNVYGLYSSVTGATGKKWAGYFKGGDVEVSEGNLKVSGSSTLMGNVGIGTTTPTYKLDVVGKIQTNDELIVTRSNLDIGGTISLGNSAKTEPGQASVWRIYNMGGSYGNSLQFWAYDNIGCTTGGLCNNRFTITDDGKVGIGTSLIPADYKLAVAGKIIAEEVVVKVQSNWWPDYVFHQDYRLKPLHEVEQFVRTNKHLPGIPSAAQVEDEGLSMGEMQNKLLQKIEELTLYMIEQDKKIRDLEAKLK